MLTVLGKKQLLDSTDITHLSAHTAWPSTSFSNEVSGGSPAYARKAITWATATAGVKTQSGSSAFDIPSGSTVRWIVGGTAAGTGAVARAIWPLGGTAKEYDVLASTDVFTAYSHGYSDGNAVVLYGGSVPTGTTIGQVYYVRDKTTNTFKIATATGGTAVNITAKPSTADALVSLVVPDSGGQRTLTISSLTLSGNF